MSWSWYWPDGGWGCSLGSPQAGAGLLVCRLGPVMASCRAAVILGLVFTCWPARLGPGVSGFCPLMCDGVPVASDSSLVGRTRSRGLWLRDLGSPSGTANALCVGLDPGPSGGQDCVLDRLWPQGFLRLSPAGRWGCVPTWLVAWPEVSQYWCQQAGG